MDRRAIVWLLVGALAYYLYLSKVKGIIGGNPISPLGVGKA